MIEKQKMYICHSTSGKMQNEGVERYEIIDYPNDTSDGDCSFFSSFSAFDVYVSRFP